MMESFIMKIFNVVRGPAPYDGGYRNEDNDETKYCVLPPDPLIMMFTAYLIRKQASPRIYFNSSGLTDLYGQVKDWKLIFT